MNLGKYIANLILESVNPRTVAIYPGAFKPPHKGHLGVVKQALTKADEVIILVSKADRGGVQIGQTLKIWDLYLKTLGADASRVKVQVSKTASPITDLYDTVKEFPNTKFLAVYGKNDAKRFNALANKEKYPNVEVLDTGDFESLSASRLRAAIKAGDVGEISQLIPKEVNPQEIIDLIPADTIAEELNENLESHAKFEIKKAGLDSEDSDYEGMIGKAVLELMKVYAKQGHSGFSAQWTRELFNKLANYETLTPITSDPEEWVNVREGADGEPLWQSCRNPALFSEDGGKTWYNVDDKTLKEGIDKGVKAYLLEMSDKEIKFWALHYDIFQQLNTPDFVEKYKELRNKVDGEQLEALNYFFKIFNNADNIKNLLENQSSTKKSDFKKFISYIGEILEYCVADLKIPRPQVEIINNDSFTQENKSFGSYHPGKNKISLVVKNRNLSDVCRTLTHELKHAEQDYNGRLKEGAGKDGDEFENEANSYAGIIMREFNRKYPEILTLKND